MSLYTDHKIAIAYAARRLKSFANSAGNRHEFPALITEFNNLLALKPDLPDLLPTLISKAEKDRFSFSVLKMVCAHYEVRKEEKPRELETWLVAFLNGEIAEPNWGSRGPKKVNHRNLFLITLTHQVAELTGLPLRFQKERPNYATVMHIVAAASLQHAKVYGKRVIPTTARGMDDTFFKAIKDKHLQFFCNFTS